MLLGVSHDRCRWQSVDSRVSAEHGLDPRHPLAPCEGLGHLVTGAPSSPAPYPCRLWSSSPTGRACQLLSSHRTCALDDRSPARGGPGTEGLDEVGIWRAMPAIPA